MDDVYRITAERMRSWTTRLVDAHATPVLLLGIGHDWALGELHVVATEDLSEGYLIKLLEAVLDKAWAGELETGG